VARASSPCDERPELTDRVEWKSEQAPPLNRSHYSGGGALWAGTGWKPMLCSTAKPAVHRS